MNYETAQTLEEFNKRMVDIRKALPDQFAAFINEKEALTKSGLLEEKTKWLLLLVASVTQRCPVCIPRAVQHCVDAGWSKNEMLEACMIPVLVGGSSAMTYVTLVAKAIDDMSK